METHAGRAETDIRKLAGADCESRQHRQTGPQNPNWPNARGARQSADGEPACDIARIYNFSQSTIFGLREKGAQKRHRRAPPRCDAPAAFPIPTLRRCFLLPGERRREEAVNEWTHSSGPFDGVLHFDKATPAPTTWCVSCPTVRMAMTWGHINRVIDDSQTTTADLTRENEGLLKNSATGRGSGGSSWAV